MASDFHLEISEIRGESQVGRATGSIEVLEWTIGATGTVDLSTQAPNGRNRMTELTILKVVDLATPALYQCLMENVLLPNLKLIGQKAAANNKKIEYMRIELYNARFRAVTTKLEKEMGMIPVETVAIVYQGIDISYTAQGEDSARRQTTFFSYEFALEL